MADKAAFDPVLRRRVFLALRGVAFLIGAAVAVKMAGQIRAGEFYGDFGDPVTRGARWTPETIWLTGPVGIGCWALANGSIAVAFLLAALHPLALRLHRVAMTLVAAMVIGVSGLTVIRIVRIDP